MHAADIFNPNIHRNPPIAWIPTSSSSYPGPSAVDFFGEFLSGSSLEVQTSHRKSGIIHPQFNAVIILDDEQGRVSFITETKRMFFFGFHAPILKKVSLDP